MVAGFFYSVNEFHNLPYVKLPKEKNEFIKIF